MLAANRNCPVCQSRPRSWYVKDKNGRFPGRKKLLWNAEEMKITNFDDANQFVKRQYRDGYGFNA
jgi:hypothetical protein